jgi:outer membrane protein
MNKTIQTLFALSAFGAAALFAQAQPAPKILVVDMAKLYDSHYKTEEQNAKLRGDEAKAQEELDRLNKEGTALVDRYKEFDEQSKNPAVTAEAKAKAQGDSQRVLEDIRRKQSEVQTFQQNTRNSFQQRLQNFKALILEEISKIATTVAQRHGATLLLDKAGPSLFLIPTVVYSDASYDITEEVQKEINKDRPANTPAAAPATTSPSSSSTTTPATDSPKITLPGSTPKKP